MRGVAVAALWASSALADVPPTRRPRLDERCRAYCLEALACDERDLTQADVMRDGTCYCACAVRPGLPRCRDLPRHESRPPR